MVEPCAPIGLAQLGRRHAAARLAALGEKGAEHVLVLAVLGGGTLDRLGLAESVALPLQATLDRPREDAGQLGLEFVPQPQVLAAKKALAERHESQPSPDRVVVAVDARPVVGDQAELELRAKLEVLAVQEPRGDRVAAGQRFDRRLLGGGRGGASVVAQWEPAQADDPTLLPVGRCFKGCAPR
jgi:hypothetical protein